MNIEIPFVLSFGLALGGFVTYTLVKLKSLENQLYSLPTPEELAKEIINIKIPISELPPHVTDKLKAMQQPQYEEQEFSPPQSSNSFKDKKLEYVG